MINFLDALKGGWVNGSHVNIDKELIIAYAGLRISAKNVILTLLLLNTTCPVLANSVDPDQLASEEIYVSLKY